MEICAASHSSEKVRWDGTMINVIFTRIRTIGSCGTDTLERIIYEILLRSVS